MIKDLLVLLDLMLALKKLADALEEENLELKNQLREKSWQCELLELKNFELILKLEKLASIVLPRNPFSPFLSGCNS